MTLQLPAYDGDPATLQFILDRIAMAMPDNALGAYPVVTALPTGVPNGMVVHYLADATNGVVWALKYRAASTSAYKWEYIGGPPLYAADNLGARRSTGSVARLTWVSATAGDPSISVPLAGDYGVTACASISADAACEVYLGVRAGATDPVSAKPSAQDSRVIGATGQAQTITTLTQVTGIAANSAIVPRYLHDASLAQTISIEGGLTMSVTPVRVG